MLRECIGKLCVALRKAGVRRVLSRHEVENDNLTIVPRSAFVIAGSSSSFCLWVCLFVWPGVVDDRGASWAAAKSNRKWPPCKNAKVALTNWATQMLHNNNRIKYFPLLLLLFIFFYHYFAFKCCSITYFQYCWVSHQSKHPENMTVLFSALANAVERVQGQKEQRKSDISCNGTTWLLLTEQQSRPMAASRKIKTR